MGFFKDFREFAVKGNVMDLAVGVIIGGAFGKIVTSLVGDVLLPVIGLVGDGRKFTDYFFVLDFGEKGKVKYATLEDARKAGVNVFAYGSFMQTVIDFLIIAFCVFIIVKAMNKLTRLKEEKAEAAVAAAPTPPKAPEQSLTEKLLIEIRDELKKRPL